MGCGVTPRIRMRRVACPSRQDVGLSAVEQVNRKEVAREDGVGLGAQESRPGRPGPARCRAGSIPLTLRISHTVDAAILIPRPASSPWILR